MFLMIGISQGQKKLNFDQVVVCGHCGQYGHLQVYVVYSYFSLFFIPLFKWGREYYVKTSCCGKAVPIGAELGRQIERGEVTVLPQDIIPDTCGGAVRHCCMSCGFETKEDYQFCPKCGSRLS